MKADKIKQLALRLKAFDDSLRESSKGFPLLGADEAGRGPLAGPVFAAAVCFGGEVFLDCVYDSKALKEKAREHACEQIKLKAVSYGIAMATAKEIDAMNIKQASLLAIRRAVELTGIANPLVAVDGMDLLGHNLNSRAIIGGDRLSMSIAAASLLAKVARDQYMYHLDEMYPGYGFAANKGYPTKSHYAALEKLGPTLEHRLSFKGVLRP